MHLSVYGGMDDAEQSAEGKMSGLLSTRAGSGPLLQRDYWAVISDCKLSPTDVILLVRQRFADFAPPSFVSFQRSDGAARRLDLGDELDVKIRPTMNTAVRVVHVDANSITLATMRGHPEAGRITFGAYRNERGDVLFHIRSRARSSSIMRLAGFLTLGESLQTNTWTDFADCVAHTVGNGVVDAIHAETQHVDEEDGDMALDTPTFIARGR